MSTSSPLFGSPEGYRLNVDEYERMADMLDDPRVELINGCLVRKMPKKPPNIWTVRSLLQALSPLSPPGWTWWKEEPVRIPEFEEA